ALEQSWLPSSGGNHSASGDLNRIRRDPEPFLSNQVDREGRGPPVALLEGASVARLPGQEERVIRAHASPSKPSRPLERPTCVRPSLHAFGRIRMWHPSPLAAIAFAVFLGSPAVAVAQAATALTHE